MKTIALAFCLLSGVSLVAEESSAIVRLIVPLVIEVDEDKLSSGVALTKDAALQFVRAHNEHRWRVMTSVDEEGTVRFSPPCEYELLDRGGIEVPFPEVVGESHGPLSELSFDSWLTPKLFFRSALTPRVTRAGLYRIRASIMVTDENDHAHWLVSNQVEVEVRIIKTNQPIQLTPPSRRG